MIKRRKIELEETNSILDIITDEKDKILFIKKETIEGNITRVKGYGKIISKLDISFSNLLIPYDKKGFIIQYLYEYNVEDKNSKLGYITIYDNKGNIYSQEHLLNYSSIITVEEGKEIIKETIPIVKPYLNDNLHKIVGKNIKTLNISKNKPKIRKKIK